MIQQISGGIFMSLFKPSFSGGNRRAYSEEDKPQTRPELVRLILRDHFFSLIPAALNIRFEARFIGVPSYFPRFSGPLLDFFILRRRWEPTAPLRISSHFPVPGLL